MPLILGGVRLTWKLPVEGNRGGAGVGVGFPPFEGGTTIAAGFTRIGPHKDVETVRLDRHAVEEGGRRQGVMCRE